MKHSTPTSMSVLNFIGFTTMDRYDKNVVKENCTYDWCSITH